MKIFKTHQLDMHVTRHVGNEMDYMKMGGLKIKLNL